MTRDALHHPLDNRLADRTQVLRTAVDTVEVRRDGVLPVDLPGVRETFADDLDLVGALQLRWHTRLSGAVERALADRPADLERAVTTAWRRTAKQMPGVRMVLDRCAEQPTSPEMADALARARRKDRVLLAAMAGLASASDEAAVRVGQRIEEAARAGFDPTAVPAASDADRAGGHRADSLLGRIRARLAA